MTSIPPIRSNAHQVLEPIRVVKLRLQDISLKNQTAGANIDRDMGGIQTLGQNLDVEG